MIPVQLLSLVVDKVETSAHSSSPPVLLFSCSSVLHILPWPVHIFNSSRYLLKFYNSKYLQM